MTFLPHPSHCSCNITARNKLYPSGERGVAGGVAVARTRRESKFEVFGEEMLEKIVAKSGSSGRVYLPPDWIGKRVKVIRVD